MSRPAILRLSLFLLGAGENVVSSLSARDEATPAIWPYQTFETVPFTPPQLQINRSGEPLAEGLIMFSPANFGPSPKDATPVPMIMTDSGDLVWYGPEVDGVDLRVQNLNGESILSYWQGAQTTGINAGVGYGNVTILDASYESIKTLCPKLGIVTPGKVEYQCDLDAHEAQLTDEATLLATSYNVTPADLSPIGGSSEGWVWDSLFVEVDVSTEKVLFSWSAFEHVPLNATRLPFENGTGSSQDAPFDFFHINSVQKIGDQYLVSSRHTWSVYLLSRSGDIIWTLEGQSGGTFGSLPEGGNFVSVVNSGLMRPSTNGGT